MRVPVLKDSTATVVTVTIWMSATWEFMIATDSLLVPTLMVPTNVSANAVTKGMVSIAWLKMNAISGITLAMSMPHVRILKRIMDLLANVSKDTREKDLFVKTLTNAQLKLMIVMPMQFVSIRVVLMTACATLVMMAMGTSAPKLMNVHK